MLRFLRLLHPRRCPRALCVPYAALLITIANMTVVSLLVTLYAFWLAATNHGIVDQARMGEFGHMAGEHGGPALNLVLAALFARWLAAERNLGYLHGAALAGILGAIGGAIGWGFGYPPDAGDAAFTLVVVLAALVGTWLGNRERDEATLRARFHDALAAAASPGELATLIAAEVGPDAVVDLHADADASLRWLGSSTGQPGPVPTTFLRCDNQGHALAIRTGQPPSRRLHAASATIGICLQRLHLRAEGARIGARAERERLAGDIHDTIAQSLAGVTTHLEAANSALPTRPGDAGQHLTAATASARTALAELRGLVWALRPASGRASLEEALRRSCERVAMESGTQVELDVIEPPFELLPDVELCLLRAAQEALRNAIRHGDARRIEVALHGNEVGIHLLVVDDGSGFATARTPDADGGHGLAAMRARVQALGGTQEIQTNPGKGTSLVIDLPRGKAEARR